VPEQHAQSLSSASQSEAGEYTDGGRLTSSRWLDNDDSIAQKNLWNFIGDELKMKVPGTDSQYVRQGITSWIHNWKKRGWKTADKKPVKNVDLWQRLDAAIQGHKLNWMWVKGHAGHPENERCDVLARDAAGNPTLDDVGYKQES